MLRRLLILALMYLVAGSAVLWVHGSWARRAGDAVAQGTPNPLDRRIAELRLHDVPLDAALRKLSEVSGIQIIPMWDRIDAWQIPRDTPITLTLQNVSAGDALDVMLELVSDHNSRLDYVSEDDAIVVTTAQEAAEEAIVRVYDVRDLTAAERQFAPSPAPLPATEHTGNTLLPADAELQLEYELAGLIEENIRTDTWKDNGGSVGSIRAVRGGLIIGTSAQIHRQIEHVLRRLRAQINRR